VQRSQLQSPQPAPQPPNLPTQAWVHATLDPATNTVTFSAASDSDVTSGLAAILVSALSGLTPAQVLDADGGWLRSLQLGGAGGPVAPSRVNGFANMLEAMKRRARMLTAELPRFPSLLITADALEPQGAFAEAQAQFLSPDGGMVDRVASTLRDKKIGVVAHFYMDPEVGLRFWGGGVSEVQSAGCGFGFSSGSSSSQLLSSAISHSSIHPPTHPYPPLTRSKASSQPPPSSGPTSTSATR